MDSNKPHEYTKDEVREMFLEHVSNLIDYWANVPHQDSVYDRLHGLAFSLLGTVDGVSGGMPAFYLVPCPHEDDKQYNIDNGKSYFKPVPPEIERQLCDIGGGLHEMIAQRRSNDVGRNKG